MTRARQHGFSLVSAIFIVVVLAFLGLMMVTIGVMQQATVSHAVQGARAYQAARSGLEWAIDQSVAAGACASLPSTDLTVAGLDGFRVAVTCAQSDVTEAGASYQVFALVSTAEYGTFGDVYYFSRILRATVTNAPAP
jgi:MSHA biogenesis protein MshP